MDRETKELKIKDHTFVVKTYATAKETNAIQSAYYEGVTVEIVGEAPKINNFDPGVQYKVQLALIEQLVTSMDGSDTNIKDRAEELPQTVFAELGVALDELTAKKN